MNTLARACLRLGITATRVKMLARKAPVQFPVVTV